MHHFRSFRAGSALAAAAAVLALAGCASPQNPRPPSLHLEEVPAPPGAARLGDQVVLTWATPVSTTDGGRPAPPLTAVLCREVVASPSAPCAPILRLATAPGATGQAADTLPSALLSTRALLTYRIEIQNRSGRSAGFSAPAFAAAGPAIAAVGPLTITGRPAGALITWAAAPSTGTPPTGIPSSSTMELTRTLAAPAPPGPAGHRAPGLAPDPSAPVLLRAAASPNPAPDGVLDPSVLDPKAEGLAFRYVAQRVQTITLGGHALELRGLPSPPSVFTYAHAFAPAAPSGLIAIPTLAPPAIDLSWETSAAADLLGYNIYRRMPGEAAFKLLNPKPVAVPSYRDHDVLPGRIYIYRITVLDRHQNQSTPSVEVQESVNP